jgi:hypothetical protein
MGLIIENEIKTLINSKMEFIENKLRTYCKKNNISKRKFKKHNKHIIKSDYSMESFFYKKDLILQIYNKDFFL